MPNWCNNIVEIKFSNEAQKTKFTEAMKVERTQELAIERTQKMLLCLVGGMFGRDAALYTNDKLALNAELSDFATKNMKTNEEAPQQAIDAATGLVDWLSEDESIPLTEENKSRIECTYHDCGAAKSALSLDSDFNALACKLLYISVEQLKGLGEQYFIENEEPTFDFLSFTELDLKAHLNDGGDLLTSGLMAVEDVRVKFGTRSRICELTENLTNVPSEDLYEVLKFNTAWSPPVPVIASMCKQLNLTASFIYYEGGEGFAGRLDYVDGKLVFETKDELIYGEDDMPSEPDYVAERY